MCKRIHATRSKNRRRIQPEIARGSWIPDFEWQLPIVAVRIDELAAAHGNRKGAADERIEFHAGWEPRGSV